MADAELISRRANLTEPVVSVVIPLFNAEEWIGQTLRSVLAQDLGSSKLEIIVVDDSSTDRSVTESLRVLESADVDYSVVRVTNGGPSRARNVGWRLSRGSWIQFLDADDLLHPEKLRTQLSAVARSHGETAVIYSDWTRIERSDGSWRVQPRLFRPQVTINPVERLLSADNFIQLGAAVFKRVFIEKAGGFDEAQWMIEDVNLMLRIAFAGGGFVRASTAFPVLYHRQLESSLSRRDDVQFATGIYKNAKLAEAHWRHQHALTAHRRELLADLYLYSARCVTIAGGPDANWMLTGTARLLGRGSVRSKRGLQLLLRLCIYHGLGSRRGRTFEQLCGRAKRAIGDAARAFRFVSSLRSRPRRA